MNLENLLPERPFFSCEDNSFSISDSLVMRQGLTQGPITPNLTLWVNPGNIFEYRPRKVLSREGLVVKVECDGGVTVVLDFDEESARVETPSGEYRYLGGIDQGNEGRGFIRSS